MKIYEKILDIAKRRGIFYPSCEIYGGISGFYDYGPIGTRIKKNVEDIIRKAYLIEEYGNFTCSEIECPTLGLDDVWNASGHVKSFSDFTVECSACKEPFRADHLVEENLKISCDGMSAEQLTGLIKNNNLKCKKCGGELNDVYNYNLMFRTEIAPGKNKRIGYMRPETAQSTYIAFKRLWEISRKKLPFGILQLGKSYRNEISPRQYIIRLREFTQAEMEFFIDPDDKYEYLNLKDDAAIKIMDRDDKISKISIREAHSQGIIKNKAIAYFLQKSVNLFVRMGIDGKRLQLRQHKDTERAFYSKDTWDVEFMSALGRIEIVGVADRGNYDLTQHQNCSRESMEIFWNNRRFVPNVIEVAYGIDRPVYCVVESCYAEEISGKGEGGESDESKEIDESKERAYFKFPPEISPYVCVFPLMAKDGLPEKAGEVVDVLRKANLYVFYDKSGSIGRRYARADEIGVSYAITIDYDTLKDNTVTIRFRDTKEQRRVRIEELEKVVK